MSKLMDAQLIEELEGHILTPARRLFILQEMLLCAEALGHSTLCHRIERALQLDRKNVRDQYHHRDLNPELRRAPDEMKFLHRRREAHLAFLSIIFHIQTVCTPPTARQLLAPVKQQMRRLQDFASRRNPQEVPPPLDFTELFHRTAS